MLPIRFMDADNTMPHTEVYEKRTELHTTLEQLRAFHQRENILSILTPPPIFVQVRRDERRTLTEGDIEITLWFGPVPVRWIARHLPGLSEHSFIDQMVYGPLAHWQHEHIFEPSDHGVTLIDRVTYAHRSGWRGWLTRVAFGRIPLRLLFFYRHLRTRLALR